jgi:long-chain fatty acid transport protein
VRESELDESTEAAQEELPMSMKQIGCWLVTGAIVALAAVPVVASGFSIYEQDAKASAMAGAWTARADNAAANWYNPAAMVRQGPSFQVGINAIMIGGATKLTLPNGMSFEPESEVVTPAHLYYVQRVGERIAWGFGINTPYGLSTEWTDLPPPAGVDFEVARKSELVTFVVNPNVAVALDDHLSIGFGINYIHADIKNFSQDFLTPALSTRNITGDGDDWVFNLAFHYDSEKFKAGISYRQHLSPNLSGEMVTDFPTDLTVAGKTTLDLPDQGAIGFAYTGPEKWELEFDVSWARWSRFEELNLEFENPLFNATVPENWDDTVALRLGGSWDFSQRNEIRFGVLRDQNPIPDNTLRPSIPDADRWSFTLGYGYQGSKIDLDFYYMALFFDDRTVPTAPDNVRGVVPGEYTNSSNLFGFTFGWRFGGGS